MRVLLKTLTDKITGVVYTPPVPVDITDFFSVDHALAKVFWRPVGIDEIKKRWQGLPEELDSRKPEELGLDTEFNYVRNNGPRDEAPFIPNLRPNKPNPTTRLRGWGLADLRTSHGPGKRKKGKRK